MVSAFPPSPLSPSAGRSRKKPFWFLALALASLTPGMGRIPFTQVKGVHAATRPERTASSPLWGMAALEGQVIERLRRFGNYGPLSPDPERARAEQALLHPRIQEALHDEGFMDVPRDPVAAVLQFLFPSREGEGLVANPWTRDPVGAMGRDLGILNGVLEEIFAFQRLTAEERRNPEILGSFKARVYTRLVAPEQPDPPRDPGPVAAPPSRFTEIDLLTGALGSAGPEGPRATSLEWTGARFAHALGEALNQEGGLYPRNFTVVALQAFAWSAASHKADLLSLTSVIDPALLDIEAAYSRDHYGDRLHAFLSVLDQDPASLAPEEIAFFRRGAEVFENPLPDSGQASWVSGIPWDHRALAGFEYLSLWFTHPHEAQARPGELPPSHVFGLDLTNPDGGIAALRVALVQGAEPLLPLLETWIHRSLPPGDSHGTNALGAAFAPAPQQIRFLSAPLKHRVLQGYIQRSVRNLAGQSPDRDPRVMATLRAFLAHGARIDRCDSRELLGAAIDAGRPEFFDFFLEQGAVIRPEDSGSLVTLAVVRGEPHLLQALFEGGATFTDPHEREPFSLALAQDDPASFRVLLKHFTGLDEDTALDLVREIQFAMRPLRREAYFEALFLRPRLRENHEKLVRQLCWNGHADALRACFRAGYTLPPHAVFQVLASTLREKEEPTAEMLVKCHARQILAQPEALVLLLGERVALGQVGNARRILAALDPDAGQATRIRDIAFAAGFPQVASLLGGLPGIRLLHDR